MSMSPHHLADPAESRADAPPAPAPTSRRRFVRNVGLGAAAVGAVAVTGGALTSVASAQTASEAEPPDLEAGDIELVQWLQSLSIAAQEALDTASEATFLPSEDTNMLRGFSRHHRDQATALGTLLAEEESVTTANPELLSELDGQVSGADDRQALLEGLQQFEERLAATMLASLGEAEMFLVAGAIAAAMAVVGQQAAALGSATDMPIGDWLPTFATTDGAYTQAAYPAP
ncbi:MAG TPA: hypothetical protein VIY72_04980 [Acidimicrobiales bacterium]